MLPPGKLPPGLLRSMFEHLPRQDDRVVTGPAVGEDTAVIDNGDGFLLLTVDPITFVAEKSGWYAVTVNVNDIAVMGGIPRWFMPVFLLPEKTSETGSIEDLFRDTGSACREYGITVIGGHTEITPGLTRLLISGTMVGEASRNELVDKKSIAPGDLIYLAGSAGIEAVSIIAREKRDFLEGKFPKTFLREARDFIYDPGICVLPAARTAVGACPLTGMHDPTEGGLAGGLWELAEFAGAGFEIDAEKVPVSRHCRELCLVFGLDPIMLISSGAVVITVRQEKAEILENAFRGTGIPLTRIGKILPESSGRAITRGRETIQISKPVVDEIHKIWE